MFSSPKKKQNRHLQKSIKLEKNVKSRDKHAMQEGEEMKTLEIDCRRCINVGENRCILYGNNPKMAIESCAADKFKNYKIKSLARLEKENGRID